ncbi:MATE family efflux transporter [Croceicoccus sp. F390]|uniref:MATE family efflux transporter n=1 Tax=Croceicoccus esteveae TaxID=3075597 RepID=A0ABU2ZGQ6_9SPHN|nr:MATE family efflux transporter [Croceicoccus sp. F390]MDT0575580.1 MATE family efflux transporter [Croceicoccus sp. F390]
MSADVDQHKRASEQEPAGAVLLHLVRQAAPLMVGVAAIMSVGIIDAYYLGQLGAAELAAVSFIFPVTTALSSLGVGVMAGVSSVVSRALGRGDAAHARSLAMLGVASSLCLGVAVAGLLYLLRMPLFQLLQAQDDLLPLIDAYMVPYALFYPIQLMMMGANGALRGQGAAKRSMAILILFAAVNWVLDPLLIHGELALVGTEAGGVQIAPLGVGGAAYASAGGFICAAALAYVLLFKSRIGLSLAALRTIATKDALALARVTGPAAFSNAINPVGLAVLTGFLAAEGQAAVAGFGAAGRLQSFAVVPLLGLSGAIGAIVGQNWGAQEYGRIRKAAIAAGGFCLAYGLAVALILFLARGPLARIFTGDAAVIGAMTRYIEIGVWGYAGYGLLIVSNGALNAVDKAGFALLQSTGRVLLLMMPIAWLVQPYLGGEAIYLAELAANLVGGGFAALVTWLLLVRRPRATGAKTHGQPATA